VLIAVPLRRDEDSERNPPVAAVHLDERQVNGLQLVRREVSKAKRSDLNEAAATATRNENTTIAYRNAISQAHSTQCWLCASPAKQVTTHKSFSSGSMVGGTIGTTSDTAFLRTSWKDTRSLP
jgi:hypothetical protein